MMLTKRNDGCQYILTVQINQGVVKSSIIIWNITTKYYLYDDVITQILQDVESKVEQYHKEKDQKIYEQAFTVAKAMSKIWSSGKYEFR